MRALGASRTATPTLTSTSTTPPPSSSAHYRSTGARRKSWPDAWQKWIRDDAKRAGERAARPTQGAFLVPLEGGNQAPARRSTTDERVAQALALAAELRAEEGSA
jgi:hypothetical protein